ncbi:epoxide hydrolase 1-like [Littorina saxatilis]|uniref:AB hydrolase-1 domain-containing protein n=1 Tax=Littorina saxatilis TaxID=31220 RepID=A0AAN9FY93_9CAEN
MAGMSLVSRLALRVGSLCVGCFFAGIIAVTNLVAVVRKGPSAVFYTKKRSAPPACLQDPSLGTHGYAHLEDVRIHYVSNGAEDKPLMLCVHGFPEFWYSWRHQLREFKDDYRVVAIDQRGYGDSDKPTSVSEYSLLALTNDLRQLVTALGYKKCVLVGHDWGGVVAWSFAQTCPEMVERFIVMNCPSSAGYIKRVSAGLSQIKKSWYITLFQVPYIPELNLTVNDMASLKGVFKGSVMGVRSDEMTDEDVEAYKYTFQRNGFTGPLNYYRALIRYPELFFYRLPTPDLRVQCPTLIIWGCKDGALDRELAALSAESVAGEVAVKYIEDSSHWVQMDRYQEVNAHVREFLESTGKKSE